MAARKTGGLGRGLDALIPNKAGGMSKETVKRTRSTGKKKKRKHRKNLRQNVL